jgi:hypothetical protein
MNVTVKLNNGQVIYPSYEPGPGRAEALIKFYSDQYNTYQIEAYKIVNQAGVIVGLGGQF